MSLIQCWECLCTLGTRTQVFTLAPLCQFSRPFVCVSVYILECVLLGRHQVPSFMGFYIICLFRDSLTMELWLAWSALSLSLCRPVWPQTHRDPPVSASWVPRLKVYSTILSTREKFQIKDKKANFFLSKYTKYYLDMRNPNLRKHVADIEWMDGQVCFVHEMATSRR